MPSRHTPVSRKSTRREFLKSAAAWSAAPYVVSAFSLGRALGATRSAPANERLTVAVIGLGNMGSIHVDNFLGRGEVQLVAVCDVSRDKREATQKRVDEHYAAQREAGEFRGCDAYNDYEDVLARPDIDAVLIAVPDHWHAIVAIAACEAGKDVYCEKPLSLTIQEATEMWRAARRYDRVFQTGSQQRSDAKFRFACEAVRSGRIGALQTVHVGIAGPSREKILPEEPIPPGFDWERWLGPAAWKPYNAERCSGNFGGGWRHIRDYSGGMMTDWGAHHIDIAQWGMGVDGGGPVEIIPPDNPPPEITQKPDPDKGVVWKYANGVTLHHGGANGVLFTGSSGKIEVNRGYLKTWPDEIAATPIGPNETHLYESADHTSDWLECIRTRRRPIADVEIGMSSATTCHLGNLAYWLGRSLKWDPQKRELLDDPYAARWLARPYRGTWRLHSNPGRPA